MFVPKVVLSSIAIVSTSTTGHIVRSTGGFPIDVETSSDMSHHFLSVTTVAMFILSADASHMIFSHKKLDRDVHIINEHLNHYHMVRISPVHGHVVVSKW